MTVGQYLSISTKPQSLRFQVSLLNLAESSLITPVRLPPCLFFTSMVFCKCGFAKGLAEYVVKRPQTSFFSRAVRHYVSFHFAKKLSNFVPQIDLKTIFLVAFPLAIHQL